MSSLDKRLACIEPDHYQQGERVDVIETRLQGAGTATFEAPQGHCLLRFNLSEDNRLRYLKQQKVADGVLLELDGQAQPIALHLVELKGRVDTRAWAHIPNPVTFKAPIGRRPQGNAGNDWAATHCRISEDATAIAHERYQRDGAGNVHIRL
ncbi:hypothetical protein [Halomonas sp. LBP4]|uniref:hypothetical protein n=1 Tax=Halomonas sp. LBP4 TaxID=2044917 RepID=UPI000D775F87|nr:hypothetical protein [Halomonas sp. LBP4]PXX97654.1 hypothetical protein CR157_13230 [Halomonas sp. LBP4]